MAEGRSNKAICAKLFLSPKTVETHVNSIFLKLGLLQAPDDHRRVLAVLRYLEALGPLPTALFTTARRYAPAPCVGSFTWR